MTHCSDDDLVLHYYGELPEADDHLAGCAACAGRARELAFTLGSLTDAVPERGERYGLEVWYRIRPELEARHSFFTRLVSGLALRPAMATVAVLLVAGVAFLAGRLSMAPPSSTVAPTRAAAHLADPQLARRVLLLTVADHLERSDRLLTDIMNAPDVDISMEQQWADDLVAANRLYRQDAVAADESSVATVLDELERTLLDIVHKPSDASAADLEQIRQRIDSAALLFKVRVLTNELRQRQRDADAPAGTHPFSPVS